MTKRFRSASRTTLQAALACAIVFACYNGIQKLFIDLAPMSWWIDYRAADIVTDRNGQQLVWLWRRNGWISRWLQPTIATTRYSKVQQFVEGGVLNRCVDDVVSTSDVAPSTREYVYFRIHEALPRACSDLKDFEGEEIYLSFSWRITLPYTVFKLKPFRLGPYVVQDGRLVKSDPLWIVMP